MNANLESQFLALEAERTALFNRLKTYSNDQLNQQPAPGSWSVVEVIVHLIVAEEMSHQYISKKVQNTSNVEKEGLKNKWRWLLIRIVFALNMKFKAPEIITPKSGYQPLADLDIRWSKTRTETWKILSSLNDDELEKLLWKHAVAGKMNLYHMVIFWGIHFRHHLNQIDRTLNSATKQ